MTNFNNTTDSGKNQINNTIISNNSGDSTHSAFDKMIENSLKNIEGLDFVVDEDGRSRVTLLSLCRVTGKEHSKFMERNIPDLLMLDTFEVAKLATINYGRNSREIETYLLNQRQAVIALGYLDPKYIDRLYSAFDEFVSAIESHQDGISGILGSLCQYNIVDKDSKAFARSGSDAMRSRRGFVTPGKMLNFIGECIAQTDIFSDPYAKIASNEDAYCFAVANGIISDFKVSAASFIDTCARHKHKLSVSLQAAADRAVIAQQKRLGEVLS